MNTHGAVNVRQPHWDGVSRELTFGDRLVKRFSRPAPSQERMLIEFEEAGWPSAIDDPLPLIAGVSPKRRLKTAIRHLNSCQASRTIVFHGNGNGCGIRWELA